MSASQLEGRKKKYEAISEKDQTGRLEPAPLSDIEKSKKAEKNKIRVGSWDEKGSGEKNRGESTGQAKGKKNLPARPDRGTGKSAPVNKKKGFPIVKEKTTHSWRHKRTEQERKRGTKTCAKRNYTRLKKKKTEKRQEWDRLRPRAHSQTKKSKRGPPRHIRGNREKRENRRGRGHKSQKWKAG